MRRKYSQEEIDQLATTVPHLTVSDILTLKEGADPAFVAILEEYFKPFAKPVRRSEDADYKGEDFMGLHSMRCLACGEPLAGMLGHFSWGICHGEGTCSCGWPARAYHYIKLPDGTDMMEGGRPFQFILQYHPDGVHIRKPDHEHATSEA